MVSHHHIHELMSWRKIKELKSLSCISSSSRIISPRHSARLSRSHFAQVDGRETGRSQCFETTLYLHYMYICGRTWTAERFMRVLSGSFSSNFHVCNWRLAQLGVNRRALPWSTSSARTTLVVNYENWDVLLYCKNCYRIVYPSTVL